MACQQAATSCCIPLNAGHKAFRAGCPWQTKQKTREVVGFHCSTCKYPPQSRGLPGMSHGFTRLLFRNEEILLQWPLAPCHHKDLGWHRSASDPLRLSAIARRAHHEALGPEAKLVHLTCRSPDGQEHCQIAYLGCCNDPPCKKFNTWGV